MTNRSCSRCLGMGLLAMAVTSFLATLPVLAQSAPPATSKIGAPPANSKQQDIIDSALSAKTRQTLQAAMDSAPATAPGHPGTHPK